MTVSTTGSSGTVSSYQWQEWSAGSWTDLGATTTSATRSESSSVAGYRSFRVVVAYTSGTPVESYAITIQWREMSVGVSASPEFPQSGPAATSTVTLTAGGDVPSGAVYQWQEWDNSQWDNLGATSTLATKDVWSATRGTRKFRVVVSHAVVASAESEPVYVTWDEWDIVAEMIGELSAAVATSTAYRRDEAALLTCMSASSGASGDSETTPPAVTFATFDDVLASYTGDVKARMEAGGDCAATSSTMFSTNESVARAELARLKAANTTYAAWLATPQGELFEANLGDPDELKFISYLGATTFEPGQFTAPLYDPPSGGGKSTRDGPDEEELPVVGTGLDCLPQGVSNGADLTLTNKLVVLNCLVFSTPHDYWVQGDNVSRDAERLRRAIDSPSARFAWLNRGDWVCTDPAPEGPVPSCLKHDVAYGSLQKFAGLDATADLTSDPDGTELDEAWNPRNKALADVKFKADISKWGCQDQSGVLAYLMCSRVSNASMAERIYFWGTARVNHKGWPVTTRDLSHIDGLPRFIVCPQPVAPTVSGLTASRSGDVVTASWNFEPGCVPATLADVSFTVNWHVIIGSRVHLYSSDVDTCTATGNRLTCAYDLSYLPEGKVISRVSIYVVPRDKEYGGEHYGGAGNTGRKYTVMVGPWEF